MGEYLDNEYYSQDYPAEYSHSDMTPYRTPTDMSLSPGMSTILLIAWALICAIGLFLIVYAKQTMLGLVFIGLPSFIGMVLWPTFALSLFMVALPTGAGLGIEGVFTINKGLGLAMALSFLFNLMVTRPQLRIYHKGLWGLFALVAWILLASLQATYFAPEMLRVLTYFQLLVMALIAYWVTLTNGPNSLRWTLRAYVLGTVAAIAVSFLTGAEIRTVGGEETDRYTAMVGNAMDANMLATIIGLALLTAIYLLIVEKKMIWRLFLLVTTLMLPVMLIRIGSRGAILALLVTFLLPFLFVKEVVRKPQTILVGILILMIGSAGLLFLKSGGVEESVSSRLTDSEKIKGSVEYRLSLIKASVRTSKRHPFGTTHYSYLMRTGLKHFPHNDIFYTLAIYGFPAVFILIFISVSLARTVHEMDMSFHKYYARAVFLFLIITSMNITQLNHKHVWVFLTLIFVLNGLYKVSYSQGDDEIESDDYQQQHLGIMGDYAE